MKWEFNGVPPSHPQTYATRPSRGDRVDTGRPSSLNGEESGDSGDRMLLLRDVFFVLRNGLSQAFFALVKDIGKQ